MIYSNSFLLELQDCYIASRDHRYWEVCNEIVTYQIKALLTKNGVRLNKQEIKDKATDATARFISMYLKDPNYRWAKNVANRLFKEAQFSLFNVAQQRIDQEVNIDDYNTHLVAPAVDLIEDPIFDLDKIDLYHLVTNKLYANAIKLIAKQKPMRYILDRAQQLRYVYLMLHGGVEDGDKDQKG